MQETTNQPGILIAIEGIDGAGKTTQAQRIADALQQAGETVVSSKEPTDGVWGRKLRESATVGRMSLDEELHAFNEDRREHVENVICPAYDAGSVVVLDRYFYSTIAYQGARGADKKAIQEANESFAVIPDMVFLLDVEPSVAIARVNQRGEANLFEQIDYQTEVRSVFLELAAENENIWRLNAACSEQEVFGSILFLLFEHIIKEKRCAKPYECDGGFCTPRLTGQCKWANLRKCVPNIPHDASAYIA